MDLVEHIYGLNHLYDAELLIAMREFDIQYPNEM